MPTLHPTDSSVMQTYTVAKSQEKHDTSIGFDFDVKTAISLERPLTRYDVINFGLNSGM